MSLAPSYADATDALGLPRLIRLGPNLYAAAFVLMKIVPARYILRKALAEGLLEPGTVITETTSGTFGLALAMEGVHLERKVILVSDPVIDERLYRRLVDLGAEVDRVPAAAGDGAGGYQAARLNRLAEIRREHPVTFCPEQYSNPDNPRSYAAVAELMMEAIGQVDCVVGPVGSGGSMSGTVTALRAMLPECAAIGVDTPGSILFGQEPGHRELRGLGMSLMPANVDHRVFDHVHWCSAAAAYRATRELHRRHALFMGPTSGAAYLAGQWYARTNPHALTVVMMPDEGYRYQDSVYDDDWLRANGHLDAPVPAEPTVLDGPRTPGGGPWTTFDWRRRGYDEVVARYQAVASP